MPLYQLHNSNSSSLLKEGCFKKNIQTYLRCSSVLSLWRCLDQAWQKKKKTRKEKEKEKEKKKKTRKEKEKARSESQRRRGQDARWQRSARHNCPTGCCSGLQSGP